MKKLLLNISLLLGTTMFAQTPSWNAVGPSDFNQATCGPTERANSDMSLSPSGTPYIAFIDYANEKRLSVRRYNGTTWEYVGSPGISTGNFYNPRIAFDNSGTPYVVFTDANISSKLTTLKFNGSTWITVGSVGFTNSNCTQSAITIDASNNIYVGYYDTNLSKMSCQKFDGTSWSYLGGAGFSATGANNTNIEVDATGSVYFKYGTTIAKYNSSAWSYLPKVNSNCFFMSMSMDNTGQPYVAFDSTTSTSTSLVRCLFFNGSNWVNSASGTVISKPASSSAFSFTKMHFGKDNKPYVGFGEAVAGGYAPRLYVNNGPGWTAVPTATVYPFKTINNYPYLAVNNTGIVYFGSTEMNFNFVACIYKYVGGIWSLVGNKDITKGKLGKSFSFDIAPNGSAYTAQTYSNLYSSTGGKIAVYKYNGSVWDTVGATNFSNIGATFSQLCYKPVIKVSSSNVPYVSYTYGYTNNTATVKKFNGTSWVTLSVTSPTVASGVSSTTDIDFLNNDTVIVMTLNANNSPSVSKFNGTNWVNMGGVINTSASISTAYQDLAVDPSGIPYIAYVQTNSTATLQGLYVKKYMAGTWQTVGTSTVAAGIPSFVTLVFDATGTPFVAYAADNSAFGRKANVKKFDGTNWVSVGLPNFTPSTADMLKMALDNSGNPNIIYQVDPSVPNFPHGNKLRSMQFNGTAWVNNTGLSHTASNVNEVALLKNPLTGTITESYMSLNEASPSPNNEVDGMIWVKELGASSSVGIEDITLNPSNQNFILYPNPNNGSFTIELNNEKESVIEIINLLGQTVYMQKIGSSKTTITTSDLKAGVYFVTLIFGDIKTTQKIIIQ